MLTQIALVRPKLLPALFLMQVSIRILDPPPQGFDTLSPWYEYLRVKHWHQFITSKKESVKSSPYFQGYVKTFDPLTTPDHFDGSERQSCSTTPLHLDGQWGQRWTTPLHLLVKEAKDVHSVSLQIDTCIKNPWCHPGNPFTYIL
jgi:hypothetical protein